MLKNLNSDLILAFFVFFKALLGFYCNILYILDGHIVITSFI